MCITAFLLILFGCIGIAAIASVLILFAILISCCIKSCITNSRRLQIEEQRKNSDIKKILNKEQEILDEVIDNESITYSNFPLKWNLTPKKNHLEAKIPFRGNIPKNTDG